MWNTKFAWSRKAEIGKSQVHVMEQPGNQAAAIATVLEAGQFLYGYLESVHKQNFFRKWSVIYMSQNSGFLVFLLLNHDFIL